MYLRIIFLLSCALLSLCNGQGLMNSVQNTSNGQVKEECRPLNEYVSESIFDQHDILDNIPSDIFVFGLL